MNKLSKNDKRLLAEAYRRWNMFGKNDGGSLGTTWLGLGFTTSYGKSEYFRPHNNIKPEPRIMGWWLLNKNGVEMLKELIKLNTSIFGDDISNVKFPEII